MTVTGGKRITAALNALPARARENVEEAISKAAFMILADMKAITPRDPNSRTHAADGLTVVIADGGLSARIGLPTPDLTSDYFWFRFLDGGTRGGTFEYRLPGSTKLHRMNSPARPALRIRERSLDGNRDDVERLIRAAITQAIGETR